jgi:hypothetical protein
MGALFGISSSTTSLGKLYDGNHEETVAMLRDSYFFLYRDIAHEALAVLIRDTRLGTRLERATKEEEREGQGVAVGDELEAGIDGLEEDVEEWDEDEVVVGAAAAMPEEALEEAGRWLYEEFRDVGEAQVPAGREVEV